ncbi:MAG: TerB family tellurite resistance protein [Planctomycetota bacterium]
MNEHDAEGVITLALLAALADGRTSAEEREQLRSLVQTLAAEHDLPSLAGVQQKALLGKVSVEEAAAKLSSDDARRTAFEIAVCVADADGRTTPAEQQFLDGLEKTLAIDHEEAVRFENDALVIASADDRSLDDGGRAADLVPLPTPVPASAPSAAESAAPNPADAEADKATLRYAVLNAALELLPQNLATMAILPLQTRMVYTIGKGYGYKLGAGHIKEFIATLGLGATSQMLENFARKAIGKFLKKTVGKTAGKMAYAATGPLMTFASTYAIGKVAKAYYAGGRTLSAVDLRAMFQQDLAKGKAAYAQYQPEIQRQASTLDPVRVLDMVRGKAAV